MINRRSFIKRSLLTCATGAVGVGVAARGAGLREDKVAMPRVSCIPILFFSKMLQEKTMSVDDWIRMASRLGLDGIEMYEPYLTSWKPEDLAKVSSRIEKAGLAVSMFTSYADMARTDPPFRAAQLVNVKRAVDAALAFKTKIVRVTAGYWVEGTSADKTLRNVADGLRQCLDYAQSRGVMLALEDHPDIGTKITDFMRILELVGDERLKVNLDTSNPMVSGDSAVELVKLVKGKVVHVHASDRDKTLEHTVAGSGAVDFPGIFRTLKGAGYAGWISLEAGGKNGERSVRDGLDYIKRAWAGA